MSVLTGKNADPEFRKERARRAVAASRSIERHSDDELIAALVRRAPAWTDQKRAEVVRALGGGA
ncbi:hypothetical protein O7635_05300 [Asanoa sp. WMMD1127]|uniref:hypothetical protein n=1 Tax=Asanoa sp. WMMD1127 TaxID=3016107 RepID=UPI002416DBE4|nr:hypothetical protein [Asanoa sp. WMMD1127]MDG4821268.1 hypothetical protein [Asanoa sp. WMMD1127]